MEFTPEQIEKAKNCKTLDEFKSLAKGEGFNLTEEEALEYFNATRKGSLTDEELSMVSGGKKPKPTPSPAKFKIGDYVRFKQRNSLNRGYITQGKITEMNYETNFWYYWVTCGRRSRYGKEDELELVHH